MILKLFRLVTFEARFKASVLLLDAVTAKVDSRTLKLGIETSSFCAADELGKSGYLKGIVVKVLSRGASIRATRST